MCGNMMLTFTRIGYMIVFTIIIFCLLLIKDKGLVYGWRWKMC